MVKFILWLLEFNRKEVHKFKRIVFSDDRDGSNLWMVKHLSILMVLLNTFVFVFLAVSALILCPLLFVMSIINAPYALYLWIKDLPYFKKKYIKESLFKYQSELDLLDSYDLRSTPTTILVHVPNTCELFIRRFFTNYNREYYTYDVFTEKVICDKCRRRSVHDLYLICKTYYPTITLEEMIGILVILIREGFLGVSKCGDIQKYVFKLKDNYTGVYTDKELDFMSGINFKQLMVYYE